MEEPSRTGRLQAIGAGITFPKLTIPMYVCCADLSYTKYLFRTPEILGLAWPGGGNSWKVRWLDVVGIIKERNGSSRLRCFAHSAPSGCAAPPPSPLPLSLSSSLPLSPLSSVSSLASPPLPATNTTTTTTNGRPAVVRYFPSRAPSSIL